MTFYIQFVGKRIFSVYQQTFNYSILKGGLKMADVYQVIVDSASVREKKDSTSSVIKTLTKGKEVKVYIKEAGEDNKQYGNITKSGNKWVLMEQLKKLSSGNTRIGTAREVSGKGYENDTVTGVSDTDYNKLLIKYVRAFGSPPKFTEEVDPYYNMSPTIGVGRAMASTWYSNPTIISFCPGSVDYLPGFNTKKNKNQFFKRIKAAADADVASM